MRKVATVIAVIAVIAVLALAGCGEAKSPDAPKVQAPAATATAPVAAAQQWDVLVQGGTVQAVSDLAGWLIEHGFIAYVVKQDGKDRILLGPFDSKAEAEARQVQLTEALTKAKKQNIESKVVEHAVAR
ncbi:SPOR domain-containing protein [Pseudomonas purpurea]|uniref:SPOR domain-containing protein n=1 Tax=Pseudomonas purpurea TaxID=3136737 RepID=UPI0032660DD1